MFSWPKKFDCFQNRSARFQRPLALMSFLKKEQTTLQFEFELSTQLKPFLALILQQQK
jgi:hypothetical protein